MTEWIIAGASSIGKSHIDSDLPNQDSLFFQYADDFAVAVVCDGAGSAKYSEQGAKYFSQAVGDFLVRTAHDINKSGTKFDKAEWLSHGIIINELGTIRQKLAQQISAEFSLKDYHSTVTGVLILPSLNHTLMLQVGDSPLITSQFNAANNQIDYFAAMQFYGDDSKDEYVNETHFITQDNWQQHLRVAWLDLQTVDLLALMTDGCGDLVIEGGKVPKMVYRPFFANLMFNLLQNPEQTVANHIVQTTLDNPATYRLTGDDKTMVVLYRNSALQYQGLEPVIETAEKSTNTLLEPTQTPFAPSTNLPQPTNNNHEPNTAQPANSVWQSESNMPPNTAHNAESAHLATELDNTTIANTDLPKPSEYSTQSALPPIQKNPLTAIADTALPTPVNVASKSSKTALFASIGAVVAVAGLVGLNKDILLNKFLAKTDMSNTQASVTPTSTPVSTLSNTGLAETGLTEFSVATPLHVSNLVVAQADGAVVSLILGFKNGTILPTNNKSVVIQHLPESNVLAKLTCTPIAQKLITSIATQGITPHPTWQYAECLLTLDAVNMKNQKVTMPSQINEIVLSQGLLPFFSPAIVSNVPNSSVAYMDISQTVVYYLKHSDSKNQ